MEKRYQIFVSSTFRDLEVERQEVMHALLELDCIPSGMELFPAANEDQWNLIQRVIDDCDYYLLILGGRYGSIGPDGISYTEMEYRYALSKQKPTIAFLHRDPGKIIAANSESTEEGKAKLKSFRESVEKKLCKYWDSPQELGSVVSRSLIQLIKSTPAVGWVRANELADREATVELLQLRRRVEDLQKELDHVRTSAPKESEGLAQGDELHLIHYEFEIENPFTYDSEECTATFNATWNEIFGAIAPLMIHEANDATLKKALNQFVSDKNHEGLSKNRKFSGLVLRAFAINSDDFQTIKIQLRALGLITKNDKPRSVKDVATYWTLTPYGDEVMTRLRAIRREEEAQIASDERGDD
ncbi:hypothetical protein BI147_00090 [Achromobacter xylosoxidans]|uniref:DUF4062 domain-containing protein n=1 Tax=Alcaligenes xylosoxydans xylosoxydans TaxID=85698 RepID=UPI000970CA6A|nr:DUF4062 domain-containing protein [Achromobacter xylosoxidans]MCZ8388264.1 DUF4062 domain-containing protein [Achromobacter xylosoxidans]OMG91580.1 hypothetical protein BI147_00090 [Achromobacter xylosoxidans]